MKLSLSAIGVLLLLALLTWLLLRGVDTNAPGYAQTLQAFDDFALAEASLDRDILQARAGLLLNYDSLGRTSGAMAAGPGSCAAVAGGIRTCHRRELDAADQLPAVGNRGAVKAGSR
jgi:hypothetical protein